MRAGVAVVCAASLLGAGLLLAPTPAHAQGPAPDTQAAARARGEEGLRLFEASRWSEAFDAFQSADTLFHAPTLVLYMAKCRRNDGKLLEARALYERIVGERLDKSAPDRFRKAQATAKDELEALRKRIPRVTAKITGGSAPAGGERATLDGAAVSADALREGKEVNPGRHVLTAEADGGRAARLEIDVKEGDAPQVELALTRAVSGAPDVAGPASPAERGSILPAAIAFGAGGAGVLVGAIVGGIAAAKIADVKSRCVAGECLFSDIPERDHARTLVTASTVGFVVGGAGLVTGTVLLVLRARRPEKPESPVGLTVGPGSMAVWGRF